MKRSIAAWLLFACMGAMVIVGLYGCGPSAEEQRRVGEGNAFYVADGVVDIVTIDSCEYLKNVTYGRRYVYTHKGNCKFCKARK